MLYLRKIYQMLFSKKKFSEPLNTAVFTTTHVARYGSAITLVSHELDGAWQFMGDEPIINYEEVAQIVSLSNIIERDKTILKISDLPKGYQATRTDRKSQWEIVKIEYDNEEIAEMGFYCSTCGEFHKEIPMAYGSEVPFQYAELSEEERQTRAELNSETCIIDNSDYFIKGNLLIPVQHDKEFSWNIWVKISSSAYDKIYENWEDENRILDGPFDGQIANRLEVYPDTLTLSVKIHIQKIGCRPKIELLESSHPLFLEQENGITKDRVLEFSRQILYNH